MANIDTLPAHGHCRLVQVSNHARQAAAAATVALYAHNDPSSHVSDFQLSAAHAPDYKGATNWSGLHTEWLAHSGVACTQEHLVHIRILPMHVPHA